MWARVAAGQLGYRVLRDELPQLLVGDIGEQPTLAELERAGRVVDDLVKATTLTTVETVETREVPGVWLVCKVPGRYGGEDVVPFDRERQGVRVYETGQPSAHAVPKPVTFRQQWIERAAFTPKVREHLQRKGLDGPVLREWLGWDDDEGGADSGVVVDNATPISPAALLARLGMVYCRGKPLDQKAWNKLREDKDLIAAARVAHGKWVPGKFKQWLQTNGYTWAGGTDGDGNHVEAPAVAQPETALEKAWSWPSTTHRTKR